MSTLFDSTCAATCSTPRPRQSSTIRPGHALWRLSLIGALLTAVLLGGTSLIPQDASASGTCSSSLGDPRPPSGEPEPLIAGTVTDADTNSGVSSALVKLYRCNGSTATLEKSTTTDSSGDYVFDSLTGWEWYYVEVSLSGPLSNMQPASGTINPSAALDVGPGDDSLDFDFES